MCSWTWGPRWIIPLGAALSCAGLLLGTAVRAPWHLYVTLGLLVSAGTVISGYTGHTLFLPHWFARKRGLATGIAFAGGGIGSIVLFPGLALMIERFGWRAACWALAGILAVAIIPLNVAFQRLRPEDMGLEPDGDVPTAPGGASVSLATIVDLAWVATDWTLTRAVRTARFWWVAVGFFGVLYAWYAVQVHQTKYLIEIGYSPGVAAWALGFVGLMGVGGQIGLGHVSDRLGREWVWTLACGGLIVCYAALLAMARHPTPGLLWLMIAAQGLVGYGAASIYAAIPAELFQGRHFGAIFGLLSVASGLGSGASPWIAGLIHDRTGSYTVAFALAIGWSVISAVAIWLAGPRHVRAVAGRVRTARRAR